MKGAINMISSLWGRLWNMHDEVKDLFRLFVNPNKSKFVKERFNDKSSASKSGDDYGGGEHRPNNAKRIGLFLGPALFVLMLLFFNPEGLSRSEEHTSELQSRG